MEQNLDTDKIKGLEVLSEKVLDIMKKAVEDLGQIELEIYQEANRLTGSEDPAKSN